MCVCVCVCVCVSASLWCNVEKEGGSEASGKINTNSKWCQQHLLDLHFLIAKERKSQKNCFINTVTRVREEQHWKRRIINPKTELTVLLNVVSLFVVFMACLVSADNMGRTTCHIVGGEILSLQDIYTRRCIRKARRIINDSSHPSYRLLSLLPSWRRLCSIRSCTSWLRLLPQAIRLKNSQN